MSFDYKAKWDKCADFHGHVCKGLVTGYLAAIYASRLLDLEYSTDEQVVCISENDACGVDAIQVITGCTAGKGNLLFHMTGKSAYSFYSRANGKSIRLVVTGSIPDPKEVDIPAFATMENLEKVFTVKETKITLPERARIFDSYVCECCGEKAGANWIRIQEGKTLCLDCANKYDRFNV